MESAPPMTLATMSFPSLKNRVPQTGSQNKPLYHDLLLLETLSQPQEELDYSMGIATSFGGDKNTEMCLHNIISTPNVIKLLIFKWLI